MAFPPFIITPVSPRSPRVELRKRRKGASGPVYDRFAILFSEDDAREVKELLEKGSRA